MAIWYEVEHSEKGIHNFMDCNWHFHDFKIERVNYLPDSYTAELFLQGTGLNLHTEQIILMKNNIKFCPINAPHFA